MEISDALFEQFVDHLQEGVYFVDCDRTIRYWNKGAEAITGYSREEVVGRCCADNILTHIDDEGTCLCVDGCPLLNTIHTGMACQHDVYLHHKDGQRIPVRVSATPIYDERGGIIGAIESFYDRTEHLAALEQVETLERASLICPLTDVANRRYADQFLRQRFEEWQRYARVFGILFVDVDKFKDFNDRLGHAVGDRVLQMVAKTLRHDLRSFDFVARWGGEEFMVVLPRIGAQALVSTANRLRQLVAHAELPDEDRVLRVTISVGATLVREGDTLASMIDRADNLMYKSKQDGRNRVSTDADLSAPVRPVAKTG